jgi:diguanylate cyclase (GGDEF)-like protein
MSTAALALIAAVTALSVTVVATVILLRSRRASDLRVARALHGMRERMDALADELGQTVEKVREDALRTRLVESLGQALDLDEVIARSAEAAASLPGVAGALVKVEVDGLSLIASAGLDIDPTRAATAGAVGGPPDGSTVRAVGISYHFAPGHEERTSMRSAVAVPLESAGRQVGFLTVFGRGEEPPVAGSDFQTLEVIARHTGPAIENARLNAVSRLPDTDGLTGLGNRQLFHETLALEVARARRHGRRLALCVLDLDDFKLTNSRVGQIEGDGILVQIADLLRETIRPTDLACRTGGDEFAVILPASGRIDAEELYARLQATLRRRPPSAELVLSLSAGIAELKPDDDGVSLFERAERALHRAKEAGKGTAA